MLSVIVDPNSNQFSRTTAFTGSLISLVSLNTKINVGTQWNFTCHSHHFYSSNRFYSFFFSFANHTLLHSLVLCLHSLDCLPVYKFGEESNWCHSNNKLNWIWWASPFYDNVRFIHWRLPANVFLLDWLKWLCKWNREASDEISDAQMECWLNAISESE